MSARATKYQGISKQGGFDPKTGKRIPGTVESYELRVDQGFDPATRKRRRKIETFKGTLEEAKQRRADMMVELNENRYVSDKKITLASYLAPWLDGRRSQMRPSSWERSRNLVEQQIIPGIGEIRLSELTAEDLDGFYARLLTSGNLRTAKPLSPRTVQYVHVTIHRALSDAVKKGRLTRNVAEAANRPRYARVELAIWNAAELGRFLQSVQSDRNYAAWHLLATTGMRRGEALGLRWRDLSLDVGQLSIQQTLICIGYKMSFSEPKTDSGRRTIALDATTVTALKAHRIGQDQEREDRGLPLTDDNDLVFAQADGSPINPDLFSDWFRAHVKAAGLKPIRVHDTRHTYAVLALRAGVPLEILSRRLGHASLATTHALYGRYIPELDKAAAEKVAGLISIL